MCGTVSSTYRAHQNGELSGANVGDGVLRLALIGLENKGYKAAKKGIHETAATRLASKIGDGTVEGAKKTIVEAQSRVSKLYHAAVTRAKATVSARSAPDLVSEIANVLDAGVKITNRQAKHITGLLNKRGIRSRWKVNLDKDVAAQFSGELDVPLLEFAPGATRYIVLHELMHVRELRILGKELYQGTGSALDPGRLTQLGEVSRRVLREQYVYDAIRTRPYIWDVLTDIERTHAMDYIDFLGGIAW